MSTTMTGTSDDAKVFGKYHDLALLVLGFVLTTLLGTVVTKCAQDRSWEHQQRVLNHTDSVANEIAKKDRLEAESLAYTRASELRQRDSAANAAAQAMERRYTEALQSAQHRWELFLQDREQAAVARTATMELHQTARLDSLNRREAHRVAATQIFDEISRAADKRIFRWWRLYSSIATVEPAEVVAQYRHEHRQAIYEWNDSLNRNRAMLCRYFGFAQAQMFENVIQHGFKSITDGIEPYLNSYPAPNAGLSQLKTQADQLHHNIYQLDNDLVEMIRVNAIGGDTDADCSLLVKNPEAWRTQVNIEG